ncbi:MAG: hypothetical protein WCI11_17705 [Candidatus Methylumidiphilus sp.]
MKEADRKKRNKDRLAELHPQFGLGVQKVIDALESKGIRPRIQDAWRSPADQLKAFNNGNSKVKFGFHNVTSATGKQEALAVDMLDDDAPTNASKSYLLQLAAAAEAEDLVTGIRWGVPKGKLVKAIDDAIAAGNWDANVKIGWDPTHIQPTGLTTAEAKSGKRPS